MGELINNIMNLDLSILIIYILILILFFICMFSIRRNFKLEDKYRRLMRGVNNKNLEELVVGYLDKVEMTESKLEGIGNELNNIDDKIRKSIQKVAVLRYKAFDDVGSDLSYSIALLDLNNSGIILTGIYGRYESTAYAKPIDKGISRYELSEEEKEALNIAINK